MYSDPTVSVFFHCLTLDKKCEITDFSAQTPANAVAPESCSGDDCKWYGETVIGFIVVFILRTIRDWLHSDDFRFLIDKVYGSCESVSFCVAIDPSSVTFS